jgi:integration host factor subunit alpha
MAVTRAELAKAVYDSGIDLSGYSECRDMVGATICEIVAALERGQKVGISGFGSFVLHHTRERMGRNPKTGKPAKVPSRRMVVFRPFPRLKAICAEVSDTTNRRQRRDVL